MIMKRQKGMTVVELMVTLAVAIALTTVGVPMFRSIMANNQAVSQTNALVTALQLARAEAVSRAQPVAVCARSSDTACGNSGDWANGWLVFVDDGSTDGSLESGEERIRVFDSLSSGSTVTPRINSLAAVRYVASGGVDDSVKFELTVSHAKASPTRCVHVESTGLVRLEKAACPTS